MLHDRAFYKTQWLIRRYAEDAAFLAGIPSAVRDPGTGLMLPAESKIDGNLLLNEGIQKLWDIVIAADTDTTLDRFNNANARLGVGDSSTAEAATQTDLQAATNKTYKAMETSYPSRANQTVTFRSVFASGDANYAWNEFCVDNGATDQMTLNRKVSAQGTKAFGQTWTLDLAITLS